MAVWEYKVISSGKGGFATPALLESFLNQLGTDEWEIVEFRGQPDNPLAFSGLARRPTQRDWTLEDAAAAAARVEAEKLRVEFEAKFRSATAATPPAPAEAPAEEAGREHDGLRRLRDTERDSDPDAPDGDAPEDEWDKLGAEDELPTFFEAMRPHLRRNQRGPGLSVGVDYLAKKWDITEADVIGALKECGLEIPDDENAKPIYVDYDGDLYWVNINRRGELWVNTKEKSRPVFRTVRASRVEPEEGPAGTEAAGEKEERKPETRRHDAEEDSGAPAAALPEGEALLGRIRPQMRRNRREAGGSGSVSFLSRALKCSEAALVAAFNAMGLASPGAAGDPPAYVEIGGELWWLNKDQRGGIWINARQKRGDESPGAQPAASETTSPAPGNVLAAVRLLLKETKRGGVAAPVGRLAGELARPVDELLGALVASGLRVPEKVREKPAFAEHAGEIFWLNLNGKGELWLNAKASKYPSGGDGNSAGKRNHRSHSKKK
ncbi:MAG TPA: hypothetical protein VMG58_08135, partial [Candidatus Sulfotelmatobacter sp.]|nr:hypothetical protein [Candidatus Sulfotelmatobacter sp.]